MEECASAKGGGSGCGTGITLGGMSGSASGAKTVSPAGCAFAIASATLWGNSFAGGIGGK